MASSAIIVILTECQDCHTQYYIVISQKKLIFDLEGVPVRPELFTAQGWLCPQENMMRPSVLSICYFVVLSQLGVSHYLENRIHNTRKNYLFLNVSAPQVRYFCCAPVRICSGSDALHWVSFVQSFNSSAGRPQGNELVRTLPAGRSCERGVSL